MAAESAHPDLSRSPPAGSRAVHRFAMKILLIAGLMITLPAIAVIIMFFGTLLMWGALASLFINFLPFAIAAYFLRGREAGH